jgi:hypothetical protein
MTLIDNLTTINECKTAIKTALENKGVTMTNVKFDEYAGKIDALQLESGDTPAPTPSADYIYSNAYLTGGETNEIINFIPHKINLINNECQIRLTCPTEIAVINYNNYDVIFTVDIPEGYEISQSEGETDKGFGVWDGINKKFKECPYKPNPRYSTIVRDNVTYTSWVRAVADGEDMNSEDIATDELDYRITIKKI